MKKLSLCAYLLLLCVSFAQVSAQDVSPTGVTTDMAVRAAFADEPDFQSANLLIDGNLNTGFVTEEPVGMFTFSFSPAVSATAFKLWNNAGSNFEDMESIGMMDIVVSGASGSLFSRTNVMVPEGTDGNPFALSFGATLSDITEVKLNITANNGATGNLNGVAFREVALAAVPEPASATLLAVMSGCLGMIRRRR